MKVNEILKESKINIEHEWVNVYNELIRRGIPAKDIKYCSPKTPGPYLEIQIPTKQVPIGDEDSNVHETVGRGDVKKEVQEVIDDIICGKFPTNVITAIREFTYYEYNNHIEIVMVGPKVPPQKILYHYTPKENLDNILKYGLLPDAKNKWTNDGRHQSYVYKDLVFLCTNSPKVSSALKYNKPGFVRLKIDVSGLDLYEDINLAHLSLGETVKTIKSFVSFEKIGPDRIIDHKEMGARRK